MRNSTKHFILALTFITLIFACDPIREYDPTVDYVVRFVEDPSNSANVLEGCDPITYTIEVAGINSTGSAQIAFDGDAVFQTDFTVAGSGVSNFSADGATIALEQDAENNRAVGSFTVSFPEDNAVDGAKRLEIRLTGANVAAVGEIRGGEWTGQFKTANVNIADADALNFSGTYAVVTNNTVPGGCAGTTNTVTLARIGDTNDYNISDITGGLYLNCYGAADNPGVITIDIATNTITVDSQPDVVYGGDEFNGTGSILDLCSSTLEYSWSNDYGDAGTTTMTKQ